MPRARRRIFASSSAVNGGRPEQFYAAHFIREARAWVLVFLVDDWSGFADVDHAVIKMMPVFPLVVNFALVYDTLLHLF